MAQKFDPHHATHIAASRGALVPVVTNHAQAGYERSGAAHASPGSYSPFVAQLADQAGIGVRGVEWRSRLGRAASAYASTTKRDRRSRCRSRLECKV